MKKIVYSILGSLATLVLVLSLFVSCDNAAKNCDKAECDAVCCPATEANADCADTCDKPCCAKEVEKEIKKCCKAGDAKECKHALEGEMKKCCAGKDSIACAEHKAAMEMHGKMCSKDSTKACCMKMKSEMCKKDCTKPCCANKQMEKEVEKEMIEEVIEE